MIPRLLLAVVLAGGLGAVLRDVVDLEARERDVRGPWTRLEPTGPDEGGRPGPHRELGRVAVRAGDDLRVDACVAGVGSPEVDLVLWDPGARAIAVEMHVDAARLAGRACLEVARGDDLPERRVYALEAIWEGEPPDGAWWARFAVTHELPRHARAGWAVVALGGLGLALAFARRRRDAGQAPNATGLVATARALAGVLWLLASVLLVGLLPLGGATGALLRGLLLAGSTLAAATVLGGRGGELGLATRRRGVWLVGIAPIVGVALFVAGRAAAAAIPSTGEAPVEALVRWPSGVLAAATVAVLAPAAEEVFFRGFLWAQTAPRLGAGAAVALTTLAFVAVHLPQTYGAWGALASIALLGVGLGGLRAVAGSVWACLVAHLAHNLAAAAPALFGG